MPKSIAILDELPRSQLGKVMRRSVRERLETFELKSGEWRERISEASSSASEYIDHLRERAHQSRAELRDYIDHKREASHHDVASTPDSTEAASDEGKSNESPTA